MTFKSPKRNLTPEEVEYILKLYDEGCTDQEVADSLCTSRSGLSTLVKRIPTLPGKIKAAKGALNRSARRAMKELVDANNVPTVLQVARSKLGYSDKQDIDIHVGPHKALSDDELQRKAIASGIVVEIAKSVPVPDTSGPCPIDATIVPKELADGDSIPTDESVLKTEDECLSNDGTDSANAQTMPTVDAELVSSDEDE